jgi:transposase
MIPIPNGVKVWIAIGHTDMRRGMQSLALTVQESLKGNPHAGDLYIFRGRRGDLVKILWHDGVGMSLYAKRLDRGKFIWPSASDGALSISAAPICSRHCLEESTINLETYERGLSEEFYGCRYFGESQRIQSVIHCFAWVLSAKRFRMTLRP